MTKSRISTNNSGISNDELKSIISEKGVDFVDFVDISNLPVEQTKGYPIAILLMKVLSTDFLDKVTNVADYVNQLKEENRMSEDEFHNAELMTDRLADFTAEYLKSKGYSAYSQSEQNIYNTGFYNDANKSTPLPHKTIAGLAGRGWFGKHNLLVTPEYGSAISMCTVLTNAPLAPVLNSVPSSQCGNCNICVEICYDKAIKGTTWDIKKQRDELVNVSLCTTCLKCLVHCPWTQKYMKSGRKNNR